MSTGTGVQVMVDLLEKTVNYTVNILLQLAYRVEGGRGLSGAGYMSQLHETIERGFRTWVSEQKLLFVRFQLYDPTSNEAYGAPGVIAGKCTVSHLDQGDKIRLKPSGDVA